MSPALPGYRIQDCGGVKPQTGHDKTTSTVSSVRISGEEERRKRRTDIMASLSNIAISTGAGSSADTTKVTVGGTMTFDASEVGKSYRLEIKIYGEDKAGDNLPSGDAVGDDQLYTFRWNLFTPYRMVQVTQAGAQPFTETRTVNASTLDEDSGKVQIGETDMNTPVLSPRADEYYAQVVLSGAPVTAKSPVLKTVGV